MFDVSFLELLVIFVVVLVLFGPDKLPEFASRLGKLSGELRKNTDSLRREFYNSVYKPAGDSAQKLGSVARDLRAIKHEITQDLKQPPGGASAKLPQVDAKAPPPPPEKKE